MLLKPVSALVVLAFAAHAAASEQRSPLMKMSTRQMFGIARRDDGSDAYQPSESVCGTGDTCAQACGAGFATCASDDDAIHCFNPDAKQTCCPGNTGSSCDASFFCAADKSARTWCCPAGMDLAACAAKYSVAGGLVSATSSTTSTSTSTSARVTTTASVRNSTATTVIQTSSYSASVGTISPISPSKSTVGSNGTVATKSTNGPTSTPTTIGTSGGGMIAPAGALAFLAAVGFAALL